CEGDVAAVGDVSATRQRVCRSVVIREAGAVHVDGESAADHVRIQGAGVCETHRTIADVSHTLDGALVRQDGGCPRPNDEVGTAATQGQLPGTLQGDRSVDVQEGIVAGGVQLQAAVVGDCPGDYGRAVVVDRVRSTVGQVAQEHGVAAQTVDQPRPAGGQCPSRDAHVVVQSHVRASLRRDCPSGVGPAPPVEAQPAPVGRFQSLGVGGCSTRLQRDPEAAYIGVDGAVVHQRERAITDVVSAGSIPPRDGGRIGEGEVTPTHTVDEIRATAAEDEGASAT